MSPGRSAAAAIALAACSGGVVHTFGAHRYDPVQDCLEGAAAVDVIEGADPGPCPGVRCWVSSSSEVYITTTACDAPSNYREGTADPPGSLCASALAAQAREGAAPCP